MAGNFNEHKRLLSASHLIEYWYCPRFIYFMEVLGIKQYQEKRLKVRIGRKVHEDKRLHPDYLRKKLGVVRLEKDVYLSCPQTGICGILDEILFFEGGTAASLDYKFAYNSHKFKTQFLQSVFYALLVEEHYGVRVTSSFVVYVRDKNKLVEYPIKEKDRKEVLRSIEETRKIMATGFFPKGPKTKKRCPDCTYRNICVGT
jgi:CRISPR-associated exonuclease Cas4